MIALFGVDHGKALGKLPVSTQSINHHGFSKTAEIESLTQTEGLTRRRLNSTPRTSNSSPLVDH